MKTDKSAIKVEQIISGLVEVRESDWDGVPMMVVEARELKRFLGAEKKFADWVKYRIEQYGFKENQDFKVLTKIGKNPLQGGRPTKEYENWINRRIEEYEFQLKQDYIISVKNDLNSKGRPSKEFELIQTIFLLFQFQS